VSARLWYLCSSCAALSPPSAVLRRMSEPMTCPHCGEGLSGSDRRWLYEPNAKAAK